MLFKKSVRRRIVLGQDGVSREMMGKESVDLLYFTACGASESCKCVAALCRFEGWISTFQYTPKCHLAGGVAGCFPAMLL